MSEPIGNLYPTGVPSLSDTADIQEALRIYHYGLPSGTGTGEYSITNTDPEELEPESVAYHLYDLQNQIDNFESGILPSAWTTKGVLISSSEALTPLAILPGTNGQVLTINSATATGLEWQVLPVTLTNTVTLSNKTLLNAFIASAGIKFNGPTGNACTVALSINAPTANRSITLPDADTELVGTTTTQTLTNKSMSVAQLTGTLPITSGGTGATTVANARNNLQIFNTQTAVTAGNDRTSYSGKIYVADPGIVGASGANLDDVAAGDLWFW